MRGVGWGGGEGKSLGSWVGAVEEVDLQRWEIHRKGLKGRGFLRIWEILMGNKVCLRALVPGVGFSRNFRAPGGVAWCSGELPERKMHSEGTRSGGLQGFGGSKTEK